MKGSTSDDRDRHLSHSYDIVVHNDDGTSLAETEDLPTYDEAIAAVDRFLLEFPRAEVNYGDF